MNKPSAAAHLPHALALVVCGLFHYRFHVDCLERWHVLSGIYFSHRRSSLCDIAPPRRHNLLLKEYLLNAHFKLLRRRGLRAGKWIYRLLWAVSIRFSFKPAAVNLVLVNGNCLLACRMCKVERRVLIGEVVNAHPVVAPARLDEEARRLGIANTDPWTEEQSMMLQELQIVDFLLCPSRATADSYVERGFPIHRIKVIPYGLPKPLKAVAAQPTRALVSRVRLLCVAQIALRKGQHLLLEGLARIADQFARPLSLTLVGDGDERYLSVLRSTGVAFDHIRSLPHAELLEQMRKFDVLILPSLEDGFGMVVTEAISVGVPVLVSRFAGASELVDASGGGYSYDPRDPAELLSRLQSILQGSNPPYTGGATDWADYASELVSWIDECVRAGP